MKNKILFGMAFLFLMIVIPKKAYVAAAAISCEPIATGNYTLGANFDFEYGFYCISEGEEVIIDLNGQDITDKSIDIYNQGKLLIKDSNYTKKEFDLENLGNGHISIYGDQSNNNKGELIIDNGNFIDFWAGNMKSITINNGAFLGDSGVPIENTKNIEIKDGIFQGLDRHGGSFFDSENVEISGGVFKGNGYGSGACFGGVGNVIISGGEYTGYWNGVSFQNVNSIKLSGGTYKATGEDDDHLLVSAMAISGTDTNNFSTVLKDGYKYSSEFETKIAGETDYPYVIAYTKEVSVEPIIVDYKILDGDNQTIDASDNLTVRADGAIADFVKLLVDGEEVSSDNYELKEGSTIAILKASFLSTLKEGEHELTFVYKNGEANAKFIVKAAETKSGNETKEEVKNPSTSDNIMVYVGMLFISASLLLGYKVLKSER